MNFRKRILQIKRILLITALVLGFSGIFGATGINAYAARTENAEWKVYTPYELCCMAQYYYKRTSEDGFYPPEAECRDQKDGTYLIGLHEKVDDGNGAFHYATYAWYSVDVNAKGTDTITGKAIDLTLYSTVYSPEELCKLAQDYYYRTYDFYPPNAQYTANTDGTYTICLFEVIRDEGGVEHNSTCGWFTVNVCGIGKDDITLEAIDINP